MARWTIYGADGSKKVLTDSLELHDEWMAECFVTVTVKSAEPIDFEVGDYIDYRSERYTIQYDPSVVKKARKDTYGEGFVYDNIKFVGRQDEIVRCDFTDIVLSDNEMHYTGLPTFPFYCGTVDDLLDRIQANLDELYKDKQAADKWVIISPDYTRSVQRGTCVGREQIFIRAYEKYIGSGTTFTYDKINIPLTANNNTCWDALKWVNEQFGLNFIVRDNVVIVGTAGAVAGSTFKYGKGNGLYEIERIGDSEQDIITRIRAYGNETNIPNRYYANLNLKCFADVTAISSDGTYYEIDLEYSASYFKQKDTEGNHYVTKIQNGTSYTLCYILAYNHSEVFDTGTKAALFPSYGTTFTVGQRLYFIEGINENTWPSSNKEQSEKTLPGNMSVTRLMLPGFPLKSLRQWVNEQVAAGNTKVKEIVDEGFTFSDEKYRPYIESPNKDVYGVRPSSVYFDGSNEFDDIHPTIKGMQYAGIDVDKVSSAQQITDNGVLADEHQESDEYVTVTIPEAGFDLGAYLTDEAAIEMVDGMCGGRSLKIKKVTTDDSRRSVCTCVRDYDDTLKLYFPYNDFNISGGDHFVLTGIDLPDSYIEAASERLFFASVSALRDNDSPSFTFQPRIDEIWMARQNDIAEGSSGKIKSLHDTLKAGDIFSFTDEDLGIDAQIIIDILTIKENGNNGIPTYEVTLRNEKVTSSIDRKIQKITSSGSGGMGSGGGISTRQTAGLIEAQGSGLFLSKIYDDVANGLIGFMKGAWFGAKKWFIDDNGKANLKQVMSDTHITSNYTGDGMFDTGGLFQYLNGKAKLVVDQVVCRGKFVVNEIEDRIWTYSGGNLIFSAAGSTIFFVEYLDGEDNRIGYTNINSPWLLRSVPLLAGMFAWAKRKSVQRSLTETEKKSVVKFRCYETSDDGTMQTRNWWHLNDIAYCQTLNRVKGKVTESGGYSGELSNTVYLRKVIGIGSKKIEGYDDEKIYDYVDLSFSDCDSVYNDWPAAGDVIVQRGNTNDNERQGFTTIEVTGTQRGVKVYDNVSDYSMEGKKQAFLGYDADKGRAQLEVFGDAYIGAYGNSDPHEGKTYVRYDAENKILEIKARISAESSIGDVNFDEYINGLITNITDAIEKQVDKKAETWYQATDPSKEWTDEEKAEHVGDLWYCTEDIGDFGKDTTWYYKKDGSSYAWEEQFIPKSVFDTLDGKASVYISRPSSYKAKDLWILAEETTLNGITYKKGEMLTALQDSDTFNESHWVKKVIYTDDSALNTFVNVTYAGDKMAMETQLDGQVVTWFQENDPSTSWTTSELKKEHLYDIWYVTGGDKKGHLYKYKSNGTSYDWYEIHDALTIRAYEDAAKAQDTADGKRRVFVTTPSKSDEYDVGDLWVNATYGKYSNDVLRCNTHKDKGSAFDISHWELASKYTDDSNLNNFIDVTYAGDKETFQNQIDGKIETWYTDLNPSDSWLDDDEKKKHIGDMWYSSSTHLLKRYDSDYQWATVEDQKAIDAYANAATAQDTADGKRRVFVATPTTEDEYDIGDLWANASYTDASTKEVIYEDDLLRCKKHKDSGDAFDIEDWEPASNYTSDASLNAFIGEVYSEDVAAIQLQIDGKIDTWFQETDPSEKWTDEQKESHLFDIWYVTDGDNKGHLYKYKKAANGRYDWDEIHDALTIKAYQDASTAQDTADGKRRVFVTTPVPPYDEGDLWTNANFTNDDVTYSNDLLRCNNSRETGPFSISDWERASKYTDDSAYLEWKVGGYADDIAGINNSITQNAGDIELAKAKAQMAEQVCTDIKNALTKYAADGKISKVEQSHIKNLTDGEDVTKDKLLNDISIYGLDGKYASELTSAWNNFVTARDKYAVVQDKDITVDDTYSYFAAYYDKYVEIRQLITKQGYDVANEANNKAEALNYIKKALGQKTDIDGGLILTSLIALRDDEGTVWSGINGIYQGDEEKGIFGNGIAAWFGGQMIDHDAYPKKDNYAKILFRMDGTGYMAGGNISWDSDGAGEVAGGNITWDKDGNVEIKGNSLTATEKIYLGEKDVTAFFEMFELEGSGTTEDPYVIKAKYGLYSESFISALGNGGSGSGGGGAQYLSQLQDVQISGTPTSGQVLTYNGTKWVNGEGSSGGLDVDAMWNELASPGNKQIDSSHINFSGYMKTTDNAVTATKLKNTFAITIGGTAHDVDGSESVSWTLADIGAASATDVTTLQGYFDGGSAKSAKKLASKVKIWGRDFDGSGEIKGAIENATTISASSDVSVGGKLTVVGASTMSSTLTVSKLITANGGVTIPSAASLKIGEATISWDSENGCVKIDKGFYSDSFISALGAGFDSGANVLKEPLRSINNTLNSNPTESNVGLVWDGTKWAFGKTGGSDMDSVWSSLSTADSSKQIDGSHLSTALSGYVTTSQLGNYLPKAGGSMDSGAQIHAASSASTTGNRFLTGGILLREYEYSGTDTNNLTNAPGISFLWHTKTAGKLWLNMTGVLCWNDYKIIHEGNISNQTVSKATNCLYLDGTNSMSGNISFSGGYSINDLRYIYSGGTDKNHALYLGYSGKNTVRWHEYGGVWDFYSGESNGEADGTLEVTLGSKNYFRGNVGIGNDDPTYKLDLMGDDAFRMLAENKNTGVAIVTNDTQLSFYFLRKINTDTGYTLNSFTELIRVIGNTESGLAFVLGNRNSIPTAITAGGYIQFTVGRTAGAGMRLDSSGNLGIGISKNISEKLHVDGYALADGYKIPDGSSDNVLLADGTKEALANLTVGNADKLDNYHASDLLTGISSNRSTNLTITVGGHSESCASLYADYAIYAEQLGTARTLWGQSFNGSANVSGDMTGVGDIQMDSGSRIYSSGNIYLGDSSNSYHVYCANLSGKYTASGTAKWSLDSDDGSFDCGNITCDNITGDDATFDNVYSYGAVTALSDARKKDIQEYIEDLSVELIAAAPMIRFTWKDEKRQYEGLHVGSIAQFWQPVLPEAVIEHEDGTLSMDYAVIALLSTIATARRVLNLEERIRELESRLKVS